MAELHVMGDYRGPGEKKTVETLARDLPKDWVVIANRALPTEDGDDMDIVVVGERGIYLLEEKAWGPHISVGHQTWRVGQSERPNPMNRVRHVGRVLAGVLAKVPGYREAVGRAHIVKTRVVLSHDHLKLDLEPGFDPSWILQLSDAASALITRDVTMPDGLTTVRASVLKFLLALSERSESPSLIGPYEVHQEVEPIGRARVFLATTGKTPVFLRCYPAHGWGPGVDPTELIRREHEALSALAETNRAWQTQPMINEEVRQWLVVPVLPPEGISLFLSALKQEPARVEGRLPVQVTSAVVADAFDALSEVHAEGLLHRGLHPRRIWLGRQMRVKFGDFVLARMAGHGTIAPLAAPDTDLGKRYRAPECSAEIAFATEASDVYSLALSLTCWIVGSISEVPEMTALREAAKQVPEVGQLLCSCMSDNPGGRPSAAQAAELARNNIQPAKASEKATATPTGVSALEFVIGKRIADRYRIDAQLGQGGFATTWRAYDETQGQRRVLKQFMETGGFDWARKEFDNLHKINHDRCSRVWDIAPEPAPGYLVLDYIDGEPLDGQWSATTPDGQAFRLVALTALEGLRYLHSHGLIHRDVTPSNIIIDRKGEAHLIDFGLTAPVGERLKAGTRAFTAPETLAAGTATVRSDLYGLASSMLFVMLGRFPYSGDPYKGTDQRKELDLPGTEELSPWGSFGASLIDILFDAVAADPDRRPASADALAARIRMLDPSVTEEVPGSAATNPTVEALRHLYRGSAIGNAGNRGLDDIFSQETYVDTLLDAKLLPEVLAGQMRLVVLTGNPGDGKTSFLVKVGNALRERHAEIVSDDPSGWRMRLNGHAFVAVYDASESHDGLSSDDLMHRALRPADGEDPQRCTVLLAVNDGRLLQFFSDEEDMYADWAEELQNQMAGRPAHDPSVALVDLKRRTLARPSDGASLTSRILDTFVAPQRWADCEGCLSRNACPMRANATHLQSDGRDAVDELVLTSHLRRRRRATFRDVRSTLAWLITGDRSCADVHVAREQHRSALLAEDALVHDLAFSPNGADYLVKEWQDLDPGAIAAPEVERAARLDKNVVADPAQFDGAVASDIQRQLFFRNWVSEGVGPSSVQAYRYLDDFTAALGKLDGDLSIEFLKRILLGLSRILGAPGFNGDGLALNDRLEPGGRWAVLKEFPLGEFGIREARTASQYLETTSDALRLTHDGGARLVLTLDTVELILRSADGELLGDEASLSVRQEIEGFAADLRRQRSTAVRIVDPSGQPMRATVVDGVIRREGS